MSCSVQDWHHHLLVEGVRMMGESTFRTNANATTNVKNVLPWALSFGMAKCVRQNMHKLGKDNVQVQLRDERSNNDGDAGSLAM